MGIVTVVIACDESGSEGEAVVDSTHPVFCHGSTDLDQEAAEKVMVGLRRDLRSQAEEIKTEHLMRPSAVPVRSALFSDGGPLYGHALMYLVDKQYFVVAKVIDLLVEELAHSGGYDLYGTDQARVMAHTLYREGPRAFTSADWDNLLRRFNSVMRSTQRKGAKATVDELFDAIERLRFRSRRKGIDGIIELLWRTRPFAEEFQAQLASREVMKTMDPLLAALPETIRIWHAEKQESISIVHDQQAALDPVTVEETLQYLRDPLPEFQRFYGPAAIDEVIQVDSRNDPRVQVADLVAGMGRVLATAALDHLPLPFNARTMVAPSSLWADDRSWRALTGLRSVRF